MEKKTSLENATARPWVIRGNTEEGVFCNSFSIETKEKVSDWFGERVICRLPTGFDRENKANAALIVRAVNSHDALVEALEKAYSRLQTCEGDKTPDGESRENIEELELIESALKLAKGE